MANIQYVGGVGIRSNSPKHLASWYTDKFGLAATMEYEGGYYGMLETPAGPLHFGVIPRGQEIMPQVGALTSSGSNISLTFRVDDFSTYMAELRERGLEPLSESKDDEGRFGVFRDPEGNELLIWGD